MSSLPGTNHSTNNSIQAPILLCQHGVQIYLNLLKDRRQRPYHLHPSTPDHAIKHTSHQVASAEMIIRQLTAKVEEEGVGEGLPTSIIPSIPSLNLHPSYTLLPHPHSIMYVCVYVCMYVWGCSTLWMSLNMTKLVMTTISPCRINVAIWGKFF